MHAHIHAHRARAHKSPSVSVTVVVLGADPFTAREISFLFVKLAKVVKWDRRGVHADANSFPSLCCFSIIFTSKSVAFSFFYCHLPFPLALLSTSKVNLIM
jgi:hypothetical protein